MPITLGPGPHDDASADDDERTIHSQEQTEWDGEDSEEVDWDECPTCRGSGTVNPLTAPSDFFCAGTTACPHCDGTGRFDG